MTVAMAENETVASLREKIKVNRLGIQKVVDPLEVIPKGLGRMKIDELRLELIRRGIPTTAHRGTRESMILLIREDVEARNTLYATTQTPAEESRSSSEGGGAPAPAVAPKTPPAKKGSPGGIAKGSVAESSAGVAVGSGGDPRLDDGGSGSRTPARYPSRVTDAVGITHSQRGKESIKGIGPQSDAPTDPRSWLRGRF